MESIIQKIVGFFLPIAYAENPPINSLNDLGVTINAWVQWITGAFWVIAIGSGIIAAFMFIMAGGDSTKVGKAKNMLLYTLIAAGAAILAYGIQTIATSVLSGK